MMRLGAASGLIALLLVATSQSAPVSKLSLCLYNEGDSCTANTAMALHLAKGGKAIEPCFVTDECGDLEQVAEMIENVVVCGTAKVESACPKEYCIWQPDGKNGVSGRCNLYLRVLEEFISCFEADEEKWPQLTQAEVMKRMQKFDMKGSYRCQVGQAYYSDCKVSPDNPDDITCKEDDVNNYLLAPFFTSEEVGPFLQGVGAQRAECGKRASNYAACEKLQDVSDVGGSNFLPDIMYAVTFEATTDDLDLTEVREEQLVATQFDIPATQVRVKEGPNGLLITALFVSEAHAAVSAGILKNKLAATDTFSRVGIQPDHTSVQTYREIPTATALADDADLEEYAGKLPATSGLIGFIDLQVPSRPVTKILAGEAAGDTGHPPLPEEQPRPTDLSLCLFDEGASCTSNTALALHAAESSEAVEACFQDGSCTDNDILAEAIENLLVCGTFKVESACAKDAGCVWLPKGSGKHNHCRMYATMVEEYASCIEPDSEKWSALTPAKIREQIMAANFTAEQYRCNLGKIYYSECNSSTTDPDGIECGADDANLLIPRPFSESKVVGATLIALGDQFDECSQRGLNYKSCEKLQDVSKVGAYAPEVMYAVTFEGSVDSNLSELQEEQTIGTSFDIPENQVMVTETGDGLLFRVVFTSEAQASAAHHILSSQTSADDQLGDVGIKVDSTSVKTYTKIPIEEALDVTAELVDYAAKLPALTDIINLPDLLPSEDSPLVSQVVSGAAPTSENGGDPKDTKSAAYSSAGIAMTMLAGAVIAALA